LAAYPADRGRRAPNGAGDSTGALALIPLKFQLDLGHDVTPSIKLRAIQLTRSQDSDVGMEPLHFFVRKRSRAYYRAAALMEFLQAIDTQFVQK